MDHDEPTLGIGFAIEAGASFDTLSKIQEMMGSTEMKVMQDAARIEAATKGMINLGGSVVQMEAFRNASSRAGQDAAKAYASAEKSGEAMVRSLQRQIDTFGKTSSEIRNMRAELRAVAAEEQGLTELAGRIRAASTELNRLEAGAGGAVGAMGRGRGTMTQFSFQLNDIATMAAMGAPPMQIFASQAGQIFQVAQMAEGGVKGFARELAALAVVAAPAILAVGIAGGGAFLAFKQFQSQVKDDGELTRYRDSLGLTRKEMEQLSDGVVKVGGNIKTLGPVTITFGDEMAGIWRTISEQAGNSGNWASMKSTASAAFNWVLEAWGKVSAGITAGIRGTFTAIGTIWGALPSLIGNVFINAANLAIGAMNLLVKAGVSQINGFIAGVNTVLPASWKLGQITAPQIDYVKPLEGAKNLGKTLKAGYVDAYTAARAEDAKFWAQAGTNAKKHAMDRMRAEADAIKAGRTPDKPKADHSGPSQAEKDLQAAIKAAKEYAAAQVEEAAKVGLTAKELRLYADAAAMAKAPTDALRKAISDAAAQREAALAIKAGQDFDTTVLKPLRDELALYGLVGPARAAAALELERSAFITKNAASSDADDVSDAISRWMQYKALKEQILGKDAAAAREADNIRAMAEQFDTLIEAADRAGAAFARSFGKAGQAVDDLLRSYTDYASARQRIDEKLRRGDITLAQAAQQQGMAQVNAYGDALGAAKGFFSEKSKIFKALQTAEQVYRAVQLAMSIASMIQDTAETGTHIANAAARSAANATEGVSAQAKLPFPANIAAMAATAAALVAMGISMLGGRGGGHSVAPTSSADLQKAAGTGTVLGSPNDKSASIARSLDLVAKNTDGVMLINNQMLTSLRSIDASIGAMAATVAKQINVAGSFGDPSKLNLGSSGSAGFLGLFSSSTTRSLYDAGITLAATTVGDIVSRGIAGSTYQIVEQVKKSSGFLGIGGGTKTTYQTTTGGLPTDVAASIQSVIGALENGIVTAAGAIGINGAKAMLDNFTVSIGQLSFNGLDAQGIEDQLNAVFSKVGDQMVAAVLPGVGKFQRVGEGLFETLERVASTVGAVDVVMQKLGRTTTTLGIDVDMGIAGMFESVGDFTSAANSYLETYYSTAEQNAAKTAQLAKVFGSLNLAMPDTLEGFRALVDAQNLTTAAGQATFATLIQLAPAFADLKQSMDGAKSAADVLSEREDLQRQLLDLQGNTAALRALDLAKLDASNRALQQQIYDLQDAQEAAKAAQQLADAWKSIGTSIMDEVKRIRGLTDASGGSFAALQGQFNAATALARAGDQDAAKSLPGLSQALLTAAQAVATSQQELRRVQAQTAASLEATNSAISSITGSAPASTVEKLLAAISTQQETSTSTAANDDMAAELRALREEVAGLRADNNSANAAIVGNTGKSARVLERASDMVGGDAIGTRAA